MKIAELLKYWRKFKDFNMREMSEKMGISLATYQRIEQGKPMDGRTLLLVLRWMLYDD
jgi:transcriptional regulator with XRE-family HTH domain